MPLIDGTANNVLLEAMASGVPVLTTDVGAIKDYVFEECGILMKDDCPKAFADKIVFLANNRELLKEMGQKARKVTEEKFSWKQLAPRYAQLYYNSPY